MKDKRKSQNPEHLGRMGGDKTGLYWEKLALNCELSDGLDSLRLFFPKCASSEGAGRGIILLLLENHSSAQSRSM